MEPEEIIDQLKKLKREIDQVKSERDQKIGRRDELLNQLKRDFDLGSMDEAKKKIMSVEQQISTRTRSIEKKFNTIKERYEF